MAIRVLAACDAIQGAFTEAEFERVLLDLGLVLDDIAQPGPWAQRTFEIVTWAARNGRMVELVQAAQAANPGNEALAALAVEQGGTTGRRVERDAGGYMGELREGNGVQYCIGRLESDIKAINDKIERIERAQIDGQAAMQRSQARLTWGMGVSIGFNVLLVFGYWLHVWPGLV